MDLRACSRFSYSQHAPLRISSCFAVDFRPFCACGLRLWTTLVELTYLPMNDNDENPQYTFNCIPVVLNSAIVLV